MITVIGSLNMDLVTTSPRYPKLGETVLGSDFQTIFGGKGANQAVAANRVGASVQMIGRVGEDAFGKDYLKYLSDKGISIGSVEPVTHSPTGVASITVADHDNAIIVVPGANFDVTPSVIESYEERIANSEWLLLQMEIPMESIDKAIEMAYQHGTKVVLNPAPFQPIPASWWEKITYVTPNEHEADLLVRDEQFEERFLEKLIITLGEKGVCFYQDGNKKTIAAPSVTPVDTTGAGDTFNGALVSSLDRGLSLQESCLFAVHAATLSILKFGAQTGMPTKEEVEDFLLKGGV
ncbi:ribokinase [Bacillaceae bacterium S4-13-58]